MSKSSITVADSFAEVIYSTNEMVIAQCYKEDFNKTIQGNNVVQGSVVKTVSSYDNSYAAFGLVAKINNRSLDNIHKPSALGLNFNELAELQPQVYDLLRKELEIYLFAYKEQKTDMCYYPPPKPMMIHDFIHTVTNEEIIELTKNFSSIINILKRNQLKIDILFNLIMLGYTLRKHNEEYLITSGKELSLAFSDDIESLMQFLKRLSQNK